MPVYSSHLLQYAQLRLGERIREARQEHGLTLKQLANRLETSSARLSQIENERLGLDLQELLKVADALETSLDRLVPADVSLPFQIARDSEIRVQPARPTLLAGPNGTGVMSPHHYWPLADLFVGRHLEPMLARIMPVDEQDLHFCYHQEEEFAFLLRGNVEFRIKTPEGSTAKSWVVGTACISAQTCRTASARWTAVLRRASMCSVRPLSPLTLAARARRIARSRTRDRTGRPTFSAASATNSGCCARFTAGRSIASHDRRASARVRCCGSSEAIEPYRSKS